MPLIVGTHKALKLVWHPPVIDSTATGAVAVDLSTSNVHRLTITGSITALTLTNPENGGNWTIHLVPNATGRTIVWTTSVIWVNDIEPGVASLSANERIKVHMDREGGQLFASWSGPYAAP